MTSPLSRQMTVTPTVLMMTPAVGPIIVASALQILVVAQIVSVS